eukprot:gene54468-74622_t
MISVLNARITYLRALTSRLGTMEQKETSYAMLKELHAAIIAGQAQQAVSLMKSYVHFSAENARQILMELENGAGPHEPGPKSPQAHWRTSEEIDRALSHTGKPASVLTAEALAASTISLTTGLGVLTVTFWAWIVR